jgi:hypothetical protein
LPPYSRVWNAPPAAAEAQVELVAPGRVLGAAQDSRKGQGVQPLGQVDELDVAKADI